ncbi:MAG: hypothetical protein ACKO34_05415, partial [Vampirovibrionales bacterium]
LKNVGIGASGLAGGLLAGNLAGLPFLGGTYQGVNFEIDAHGQGKLPFRLNEMDSSKNGTLPNSKQYNFRNGQLSEQVLQSLSLQDQHVVQTLGQYTLEVPKDGSLQNAILRLKSQQGQPAIGLQLSLGEKLLKLANGPEYKLVKDGLALPTQHGNLTIESQLNPKYFDSLARGVVDNKISKFNNTILGFLDKHGKFVEQVSNPNGKKSPEREFQASYDAVNNQLTGKFQLHRNQGWGLGWNGGEILNQSTFHFSTNEAGELLFDRRLPGKGNSEAVTKEAGLTLEQFRQRYGKRIGFDAVMQAIEKSRTASQELFASPVGANAVGEALMTHQRLFSGGFGDMGGIMRERIEAFIKGGDALKGIQEHIQSVSARNNFLAIALTLVGGAVGTLLATRWLNPPPKPSTGMLPSLSLPNALGQPVSPS